MRKYQYYTQKKKPDKTIEVILINPLEAGNFDDKFNAAILVHNPHHTSSNEETFLQYFLRILNHPLQSS